MKRSVLVVGVVLLTGILLVSCRQDVTPTRSEMPLSVVPTPSALSSPLVASISPAESGTGHIYAAQFRGEWAAGYPYPIFFLDVPPGTTRWTLDDVTYGPGEPLNGVHPRLREVAQTAVWPSGSASRVVAENFVYDETTGLLLKYDATQDEASLDTAAFSVSLSQGVGISYLGDTGGVNVFYNCSSPIHIDYQELSANPAGRPAEAVFEWDCGGDHYHISVQTTWGKLAAGSQIDVIQSLTAEIVRE